MSITFDQAVAQCEKDIVKLSGAYVNTLRAAIRCAPHSKKLKARKDFSKLQQYIKIYDYNKALYFGPVLQIARALSFVSRKNVEVQCALYAYSKHRKNGLSSKQSCEEVERDLFHELGLRSPKPAAQPASKPKTLSKVSPAAITSIVEAVTPESELFELVQELDILIFPAEEFRKFAAKRNKLGKRRQGSPLTGYTIPFYGENGEILTIQILLEKIARLQPVGEVKGFPKGYVVTKSIAGWNMLVNVTPLRKNSVTGEAGCGYAVYMVPDVVEDRIANSKKHWVPYLEETSRSNVQCQIKDGRVDILSYNRNNKEVIAQLKAIILAHETGRIQDCPGSREINITPPPTQGGSQQSLINGQIRTEAGKLV